MGGVQVGRGGEGRSVQSMGEMGIDFCPNFFQPFLESIDRRSCDDGGWQLIPLMRLASSEMLFETNISACNSILLWAAITSPP